MRDSALAKSKRGLIIPKRLLNAVEDGDGENMSFFAESSFETTKAGASVLNDDKTTQRENKIEDNSLQEVNVLGNDTLSTPMDGEESSENDQSAKGYVKGYVPEHDCTRTGDMGSQDPLIYHYDVSSGGTKNGNGGHTNQTKSRVDRWIASPDDLDDEALIQALRNQRDRNLVLQVEAELYNYVSSALVANSCQPLFYPHLANPFHRLLVHHLADRFNLSHTVVNGPTPYININVTENTIIPGVMLGALVSMYPEYYRPALA